MPRNQEYDYEEDLEIDPDDLHIAWLEQPRLMMKYAEAAAQAKKRRERAHEKVKLVRSELVKKKKLATPSATVPQIEAYYRTHPKHKKAKKALTEAEYDLDMMHAAVTSFHHRKSSLENLVRLHGQQYFAGPEIPKEINRDTIKRAASKMAKNKVKNRKKRRKK